LPENPMLSDLQMTIRICRKSTSAEGNMKMKKKILKFK